MDRRPYPFIAACVSHGVLEVEVKIPVADAAGLVQRLAQAGARPAGEGGQRDTYFHHPARDLAAADEAFRLRREEDGFELTYKGPRQQAAAKVREEHNVAVVSDPTDLLEALGFTPAAEVYKRRRAWHLDGAVIALDEVTGLGIYVEIEVADGTPAQVHDIARRLGLDPEAAEPRSYLEMLSS